MWFRHIFLFLTFTILVLATFTTAAIANSDKKKRGKPYAQANASMSFPNGWNNCQAIKKIEKNHRQDCTHKWAWPVPDDTGTRMEDVYWHRAAYLKEKDQEKALKASGAKVDQDNMYAYHTFEGLRSKSGKVLIPTIWHKVYPLSTKTAFVMNKDKKLFKLDLVTGEILPSEWNKTRFTATRLPGRAGPNPTSTILMMQHDIQANGLRKITFINQDGSNGVTLANVAGPRNKETETEFGLGIHNRDRSIIFRILNSQTQVIETVITDRDGKNLRGLPPDTHYFSRGKKGGGYYFTFITPIATNTQYLGGAKQIATSQKHLWWFLGEDGTPLPRPNHIKGFIPYVLDANSKYRNRLGDVTGLIVVSEENGQRQYRWQSLSRGGNLVSGSDMGAYDWPSQLSYKNDPVENYLALMKRQFPSGPNYSAPMLDYRLMNSGSRVPNLAFKTLSDPSKWYISPLRTAYWGHDNLAGGSFGEGRTIFAAWQNFDSREGIRAQEKAREEFLAEAARQRAELQRQSLEAYERRRAEEKRQWEAERAEYQRRAARSVYTFSGGSFGVAQSGSTSRVSTISSSEAYKAARDRGIQICKNTGGSNCER